MEKHGFRGKHVLGELFGINACLLDDPYYLMRVFQNAIEKTNATVCAMEMKKFDPIGVTLLALLSESHASIHTYPERNALFFDVFTCGDHCTPECFADSLAYELQAQTKYVQVIVRGVPAGIGV